MKEPDTNRKSSSRPGYYGMPASDAGNFDWREYYFAVKERLWLVIICTVIFTFWGFYQASKQIFQYRANAVLHIEQEKSRLMNNKVEEVRDDQIKSIDVINTLVYLIDSYPFALRVANRLQLAEGNNFVTGSGFFGSNPSPESIAGAISGMVSTSYRANTDLIDISVSSRSGDLSVKLANAYADEYLRYVDDQKRDTIRKASSLLVDEADRLRKKMTAAEDGMQSFREREKAADIETLLQEAQAQISECSVRQHNLSTQLAQVTTDLEAANAYRGDTQKLLTLPSVFTEPQIASIQNQIANLESQFSLIKLRYRAKHPIYITIKTQIDLANADLNKLLENVVPLLQTTRDNLTAQEKATAGERESAENRLLEVTRKENEYNDLKRELDEDSALYEAALSRIKEVDVTKDLSDSSVNVQEYAEGAGAVGKSPVSIVMKNFLTGLALGLAAVIALHKLDSSFKTVDHIERFTELSVLAAIPQVGGSSASALGFLSREQVRELLKNIGESLRLLITFSLPLKERLSKCLDLLQPTISWFGNPHRGIALSPEHELVVRDDRNGIVAETFRSLRATVAMNPKVENLRTFLFTSAVPAEGKSFCSANFSVSLAQQGLKTLLIDADLRKPMVSRIFFNMNRKPGLADVLLGTATIETAINTTATEGLSILTAGTRVPNPSEILAGQNFRDLITEALKKYDRVVIDSAPVLAVSDTLLIALQAEILCLVVRAFVTPKRLIRRAIKSLQEVEMQPAGIVLNCLPYAKGSYYYYSSGKYYGDYGKKDSSIDH